MGTANQKIYSMGYAKSYKGMQGVRKKFQRYAGGAQMKKVENPWFKEQNAFQNYDMTYH